MKIRLITGCKDTKVGGLTRYEESLIDGLNAIKEKFEVVHIHQIKKPARLKQILNLLFSYKKKNKNRPIIHLLNQSLALSLNFVKMQNVIVTVHDLAFIIPKYYKKSSIFKKLRYKLVMRGLKRAERIIVDIPFTKKEVVKYLGFNPSKIDVVPLGVDHSLFKVKKFGKNKSKKLKYRHYKDSHIILYVGSEVPRMNFFTLLKAFNELKKELPSVRLIKVGRSKCPEERKKIISFIKKKDLEKDIKFVEEVSEDNLVNYYNAADLSVYPIEYTGFGLPPLEAMACGCPVISSNGSCLPEVVGDAALFFNPRDSIQLSERMYEALTDNKLCNNLIKKGLKRSKSFTWEKCAKGNAEIYRKFAKELKNG